MKGYWIFQLLVSTLLCSCVMGQKLKPPNHQFQVKDDTPTCYFDDFTEAVVCVNLAATNMDMLQQALQQTAQSVDGFGLSMFYSDGPSIETDMFLGYNLTFVEVFECNFSTIPYELLGSVESQLHGLYLGYEQYSSLETTPPDIYLRFAEYLYEFVIEYTNIQTIDPSTFTQYTNLNILYLNENNINSIGLELLGMQNLKELHLDVNNLSTIETGAFRDLKNLELLDLYSNSLTNLQDGAFIGLETSPIQIIYLGENPWNCSCDLQWLKSWLDIRNLTYTSEAYCSYPTQGYFDDINFC